MFTVEKEDISRILRDFGISSDVAAFSELQRYHYEKNDPASKDVRLIIRADLAGGRSVVVRFKHEPDVTLALVNAQSRFAGFLADNGIKTPALFLADRACARWYTIRGYDVIVTVEAFAAGELREVSDEIAQKTGGLLARMHNIAQAGACHVPGGVLFDPPARKRPLQLRGLPAARSVPAVRGWGAVRGDCKGISRSFTKDSRV